MEVIVLLHFKYIQAWSLYALKLHLYPLQFSNIKLDERTYKKFGYYIINLHKEYIIFTLHCTKLNGMTYVLRSLLIYSI
jgi:hypothetical protein